MSNHIPSEDFFGDAPEGVDEQVSINHTNCTAGEDRRGRLYIKRVEPNVVVAYCHNCGLSGYCIDGYTNIWHYRKDEDHHVELPPTRKLELPRDSEFAFGAFPTDAKEYLLKYNIEANKARALGIAYSQYYRRLVFPVYDHEGLVAYQLRRVFEDDLYPKYLTKVQPGKNRQVAQSPLGGSPRNEYLVICEDLISSACLRYAGVWSYPLLGADLDIHNFTRWGHNTSIQCVSWMDNDSYEIRDMSLEIKKRLIMSGYKAGCVIDKTMKGPFMELYSDPKNYTSEEIKGILSGVQIDG